MYAARFVDSVGEGAPARRAGRVGHGREDGGMDRSVWDGVERLREWLDAEAAPATAGDVRLLRVLKIGEEYGEVAEALHGALGANPRKGASHTWQDVEQELCDVIVTSMVALATINEDGARLLDERVRHLVRRALPDEPA
ncbi:MazG-like family protein [Streptomyces sp. NPDC047821]|uniref:MazG-like family protein n=1 Tax=Streptomyces sp. NPDC047821 TaxID=3365488 RepID=UPI00371CEEC5